MNQVAVNTLDELAEYLKKSKEKGGSLEIGSHYIFGRSLIKFNSDWHVIVDQFEIIISDKNQEFAIINEHLNSYTTDKDLMETLASEWDIEVYTKDECTIGFRIVNE